MKKVDNNIDPEFEKILEEVLETKNNVTSDDGKVTLHFTGVGEYTKVEINCFLEETNKEELEKDFLSVLAKSKEAFSSVLSNLLAEFAKKHEETKEENDDDEYGVTIDNVS